MTTPRPIHAASFLLFASALPAAAQTFQVTELGNGCPGGGAAVPEIGLTGTPVPGGEVEVTLSTAPGTGPFILFSGFDATDWGGLPLPLDLTGFGYAGCSLEVDIAGGPSFLLGPDASGSASLPLDVWPAGLTVYFQAVQLNPFGLGFTRGLAVTPGDLPAAPPVSQNSTDEGAQVDLPGLQLPTSLGAPDILVEGTGPRGFLGRSTQVDATGVVATVKTISKYAESKPLSLFLGEGKDFVIPDVNGVAYPNGGWSWRGPADGTPIVTPDSFQVSTATLAGECKPFDDHVDLMFRLENGELRASLPGLGPCTGDSISITLRFTTDQESSGTIVEQSNPFLFANQPWSFAYFNVTTPLALGLDPTRYQVTFEPGTKEIVIKALGGATFLSVNPTSHVRLWFDMDNHSTYDMTKGVCDGYSTANGSEFTTPLSDWRAAFDAAFAGTTAQTEKFGYDQTGVNKYTLESFSMDDPVLGAGAIRAVQLQVRMKGLEQETDTDFLNLGWGGDTVINIFGNPEPVKDWGINLKQFPDTGFQWVPGQDALLTLDLSQLLRPDGTTRSILHRVIEDPFEAMTGRLDIHLQDDSMFDCLKVCVLRCDG